MVNFNDNRYNSGNLEYMYNINTFATIGYMAFGIETERIKNVVIQIENSKTREISNKVRFYVDALFSPYTYYANVLIPNDFTFSGKVFNVNRYTKREYFGMKGGWEFYSLRKPGISAGAEVGYIPNANLYAFVKIGAVLNLKGRVLTK